MEQLAIYCNWAAYDELSDKIELTEALSMNMMDHVLRLREQGVRIDAYLMDCFWYAPESGYRKWREPHFPNGPEKWLAACKEHNLIPGLWFSGNTMLAKNPLPEWEDSLNPERSSMSFFEGGFTKHWIETLQMFYDMGFRLFKIDFVDLWSATASAHVARLPHQIREANVCAFVQAIATFKNKNPGARFLGYNGLGGQMDNTSRPFRKTVDIRLMDAFDTLYLGDPRPSDVPCQSFWRSKDFYTDHMLNEYLQNHIDYRRLDNCSFMIGDTGTCYNRGKEAWKGTLILSHARGGLFNLYYGDIGLLTDEDAAWFAKVQELFLALQQHGELRFLGGDVGQIKPAAYWMSDAEGGVLTVLNPTQKVQQIPIECWTWGKYKAEDGQLLFADAGYTPAQSGCNWLLGPEQIAVIGFGNRADQKFDLGRSDDIVIPNSIQELELTTQKVSKNKIQAKGTAPSKGRIRIVATQWAPNYCSILGAQRRAEGSLAHRSSGGGMPDGRSLSEIIQLEVQQEGKNLPLIREYDKVIWSGLSWAVAEVDASEFKADETIQIQFTSTEAKELELYIQAYSVHY